MTGGYTASSFALVIIGSKRVNVLSISYLLESTFTLFSSNLIREIDGTGWGVVA